MTSHRIILNRDFTHPTDGWYHIEALGEHHGVMGENGKPVHIIQVIDSEAATSIVNRFNRAARDGKLRHGHELLIDHEHFSDQIDKESRAYGWLQELQNRADGIYARIRWTATGKAAVDGGDYRFFSTEYDRPSLKVLNSESPRRVRPLQLDGLTLTNMHNNRGQKPITNRDTFADPGGSADQDKNNKNNQRKNMQRIAQALGLAAEASEDAILDAITKLKTDAGKSGEMKQQVETMTNRIKALESDQVTTLIEAHGIKDEKVINRLRPVLENMPKREDQVAFIEEVVAKPATQNNTGKVLNRADAKNPGTKTGSSTSQDDAQAKADKIRNRASELVRGGMKFDAAWNEATREVLASN